MAQTLDEILPLITLCASGKLYEVEEWITEGKPIQCVPSEDPRWRKLSTPLQIAADRGFHSLAALLLVNGYDPNGDDESPLSSPVRSSNHSMVSLLLEYGTDPCGFDFCDALETYDRALMDRLVIAGANPCLENAVARALRHKARPLLGFVKSYREQFPCMQRQIDIALNCAVNRGDERGVALMLWLGGNPHAQVPCSPYPEDEEHELDCLESPFERSLWMSREATLEMLLKKTILSLLVAVGLVGSSPAQERAIDDIMHRSIKAGEVVPGAQVLVAKNGRVIFTGSYGFADVDHKTPFNSESVFDLASCSKQFTAVAVLMLVDQGKIGLHEPIQKYLPEIQPNNGKKIEVRDLLHMTAGFRDYQNWFGNLENATNEEVAKKASNKQYKFPVGEKYDYSNTAYALLALLVQRVSGEPFAQFMSSKIFKPLGMNHTLVLDNPPMEIPNRVQGYTVKQKEFKPVRDDTRVVGDGQVFTTAQDLVLWDKGLREGKLLRAETLNHAYIPGKLKDGKKTEYGMGYEISQEFGKKWH